jgi:hypothetical protein
LKDRSE